MVTAEHVWKAIQQDGDLVEVLANPEQREIMREYVEKRLLAAMEYLIDEVVTVESVCRAKIEYIEDALEYALMERLIEAIPEDDLPWMFDSAEEMAEAVSESARETLLALAAIAVDAAAFLVEHGVDEKEFFAELGLSHDNLQAVLDRKLTIGNLLLSQPGVIFINQD